MKTVQGRILRYFLVIIFLMASMNIAVIWMIRYYYKAVADLQSNMLEAQLISLSVDQFLSDVENYILSGNEQYIDSYSRDLHILKNRVSQLMDRRERFSPEYFLLSDIGNMLLTFDRRRSDLLRDYELQVERIYLQRPIAELTRITLFIKNQVDLILRHDTNSLRIYFEGIGSDLETGENLIYLAISLILILCIVFALRFSRQISIPIHNLAEHLRLFAAGQLDIPPLEEGNTDEISIMVSSFNNMTREINELIGEIKEKAHIEAQFKEQSLKMLEVENLLKQSELELLQAQINPHFLFNTLNTISTLADIESAVKTKEVLNNMAHILRYNLKRSKEVVSLKEELDTVLSYLQIQKTRFPKRLEYSINADPQCLEFKLPGMVLQPFVENAVIHGLEPYEHVCRISITAVKKQDDIIIQIIDNGAGISPERMKQIEESKNEQISFRQYFGINNVRRRLQLFYGRETLKIESVEREGTQIFITLPTGEDSEGSNLFRNRLLSRT
jgi:two-component system, sensor histidine kinase YesM